MLAKGSWRAYLAHVLNGDVLCSCYGAFAAFLDSLFQDILEFGLALPRHGPFNKREDQSLHYSADNVYTCMYVPVLSCNDKS